MDFPGGAVVKTGLPLQGAQVLALVGEQIAPHTGKCMQKIIKTKKK